MYIGHNWVEVIYIFFVLQKRNKWLGELIMEN